MAFHSVLPIVNLQVKFLSKFGVQLIHFNPKKNQFASTSSTFRNQIKKWIVPITVWIIFLNGCHAIFFREDVSKKFVELFTLAAATGNVAVWKVLGHPDPFVSCMNMMLDFEKNGTHRLGFLLLHDDVFLSSWKLGVRVCGWSALSISAFVPFGMMLICFYDPSLPPFLGSVLPLWNEHTNLATKFVHIAVNLWQTWAIYCFGFTFCLTVGQILFGTLLSVTMNITALIRSLKHHATKITIVQVNFFQQVEILVSHLNLCFRPAVLPGILLYAVSVNIFCIYLTVSTKFDIQEHVGNAIFPFMAIETAVALLGFGLVAGLANKRSTACTQNMKRTVTRTDVVLKKIVNGLAPIKVRFGNNFIEVTTPLVTTAFCAKSTVRLLLLD
ncbi:hypothetical protein Fcan01_16166 [Folsomia candida]|uniref:Uncharacterized protein n=1 Tax=Folsomia candida TaxID=158441 RepID=A0A226DTV6_FOLCA|nr:hypothetical protein Fcan01_16166 [Folsomia candida]